MIKKLLLLKLLFINILSYSQDLLPKGRYDQIVNHSFFTLSYAEDHEQAVCVVLLPKSHTRHPNKKH